MSNELTESERAAIKIIERSPDHLVSDEELARAVVAAVAPIIKRETLDRFGDRMGRFNS